MKKLLLFLIITITSCSKDDNDSSNFGIPENGLLAYYPFEGNSNDASFNTNNGTVNIATLTTGRKGDNNSAYDFSGAESNIDIGDVDFFHGSTNSFSISAWVKINTLNSSPISIVSKLSQNSSISYCGEFEEEMSFYIFSDGTVGFNYYEEADVQSDRKAIVVRTTSDDTSNNFTIGEWVHLAVTYNGNGGVPTANQMGQIVPTRTNIYINGILKQAFVNQVIGDVSQGIEILDRDAHLAIGNVLKSDGTVCDDRSFNGAIDDVAIYNRVLSATDITNLYNAN